MAVEVGMRHEDHVVVTAEMSAVAWGNVGVHVLSTPHLVGLFEMASGHALAPALQENESSVGTHVDIRHVKATRVGDTLRVQSEVVAVEGRQVRFRVYAHDSEGLAGEGSHERRVVDLHRFLQRLYGDRTPE